MRYFSAITLAFTGIFVTAGLAAESVPQSPTPATATRPDINTPMIEYGVVEIPFKPVLSKDVPEKMFKFLQIPNIRLNEEWLEKKVREQLLAHRREIELKDPAYFQQIDRHAKELAAEAAKAFADAEPAIQKKISTMYDEQFAKLIADLDKDSPIIQLSAAYRFKAQSRSFGDPGWTTPKAGIKDQKTPARAGEVSLDQDIQVAAATVPIPIAIKLKATITLTASYAAIGANAADLSMPVSRAGVDPQLGVKGSLTLTSDPFEMLANVGQTGSGISWSEILPRVNGTLKADPKTPKPPDDAPKGQ